jgi:hypothetical protein
MLVTKERILDEHILSQSTKNFEKCLPCMLSRAIKHFPDDFHIVLAGKNTRFSSILIELLIQKQSKG